MSDFLLWSIVLVNVLAFLCVALDKWFARTGKRRVPEGQLLLFGLLGGFPAVWLAMSLFRHKTAKRSFQWKLLGVTALNVGWALLYWHWLH
jgi:uncharacterized membrane protein YsdA (DUF1294 family)